MSEPSREIALTLLGKILHDNANDLCKAGLVVASLGGGVVSCEALAETDGPGRSVVVLFCGPIPDDLVQALGKYCQGLEQDLTTTPGVHFIHRSSSAP